MTFIRNLFIGKHLQDEHFSASVQHHGILYGRTNQQQSVSSGCQQAFIGRHLSTFSRTSFKSNLITFFKNSYITIQNDTHDVTAYIFSLLLFKIRTCTISIQCLILPPTIQSAGKYILKNVRLQSRNNGAFSFHFDCKSLPKRNDTESNYMYIVCMVKNDYST